MVGGQSDQVVEDASSLQDGHDYDGDDHDDNYGDNDDDGVAGQQGDEVVEYAGSLFKNIIMTRTMVSMMAFSWKDFSRTVDGQQFFPVTFQVGRLLSDIELKQDISTWLESAWKL